jgi:tRNA(adenine34) deaminase
MRLALSCANNAFLHNEVPIGAIITDGEKIISEGWNQTETLNDSTAHAEIIAIKNASEKLKNWRLNNLHLFVTVEPCTMCAGAILNSRISTLVFGTSEPNTGAAGSIYDVFANSSNPPRIIRDVLQKDCQELMQKFFKARRQ